VKKLSRRQECNVYFYLPATDEYREVKGWEQGLEKVESFRSMVYNIKVVKDKDIS